MNSKTYLVLYGGFICLLLWIFLTERIIGIIREIFYEKTSSRHRKWLHYDSNSYLFLSKEQKNKIYNAFINELVQIDLDIKPNNNDNTNQSRFLESLNLEFKQDLIDFILPQTTFDNTIKNSKSKKSIYVLFCKSIKEEYHTQIAKILNIIKPLESIDDSTISSLKNSIKNNLIWDRTSNQFVIKETFEDSIINIINKTTNYSSTTKETQQTKILPKKLKLNELTQSELIKKIVNEFYKDTKKHELVKEFVAHTTTQNKRPILPKETELKSIPINDKEKFLFFFTKELIKNNAFEDNKKEIAQWLNFYFPSFGEVKTIENGL